MFNVIYSCFKISKQSDTPRITFTLLFQIKMYELIDILNINKFVLKKLKELNTKQINLSMISILYLYVNLYLNNIKHSYDKA